MKRQFRRMRRRDFVSTTVGAGLALWAAPAACSPSREANSMARRDPDAHPPIGLQLYTVRDRMARDVPATLEAIAAIGYEEVEFAGYFDLDPAHLHELLSTLGLRPASAHWGLDRFTEQLEETLASAATIGHEYLVLPWLSEERRGSLDAYRRTAALMNRIGRRCREAGVRFAYHNHAFEFTTTEGAVPFDLLVEDTDPELVWFEMDVFWTVEGGADPLEYIERYPGRFSMLHVKDRAASGEMVDVGAGAIDFGSIIRRLSAAGPLDHLFIEHDRPDGSLRFAEASFRSLTATLTADDGTAR